MLLAADPAVAMVNSHRSNHGYWNIWFLQATKRGIKLSQIKGTGASGPFKIPKVMLGPRRAAEVVNALVDMLGKGEKKE